MGTMRSLRRQSMFIDQWKHSRKVFVPPQKKTWERRLIDFIISLPLIRRFFG